MKQFAFLLLLFICSLTYAQTGFIVDGYMDKISYESGECAKVFINYSVTDTGKTIRLYALDSTIVDSVKVSLTPQTVSNTTPWESGFGYTPSFTYKIPPLKSGIYMWENNIGFIIKNPSAGADITVVFPSNTNAAYNPAGGKSLYPSNSTNQQKANTVSFLRPVTFSGARAFLRWMLRQPGMQYQVIADMDMEHYDAIKESKLLIVIGHSEYWTRAARKNFDRFVDDGKNAMVLSGNTMWWQVRYSADSTKMICYKSVSDDPETDALLKGTNWPDPSLKYSVITSIGLDYAHGVIEGQSIQGWSSYKILTPASPLLEGTGLVKGDFIYNNSYEYDGTLLAGIDANGDPLPDSAALGFCRYELIGYDLGQCPGKPGIKCFGTFVALKKTASSGIIINTGGNNWCGGDGAINGKDSTRVQRISYNMISKLLSGANIFADSVPGCDYFPIENVSEKFSRVMLFPNPAAEEQRIFSIYLIPEFVKGQEAIVSMFNAFGELCYRKTFFTGNDKTIKNIPVPDFVPGFYSIQIQVAGETFAAKLIKQ